MKIINYIHQHLGFEHKHKLKYINNKSYFAEKALKENTLLTGFSDYIYTTYQRERQRGRVRKGISPIVRC